MGMGSIARFVAPLIAAGLNIVGAHAAERSALVVGGGCETVDKGTPNVPYADTEGPAKGRANLFRPEFELAHQSLKKNGWKTAIQYDSDSWQRPWPGAVASSRKALLAELDAQVKKLRAGDQFLLAIATHGSPPPHNICLGNGETLYPAELERYLKALRKKKVKVAVLDASCFSGNTVRTFSKLDVCTMSITGTTTTSAGDSVWNSFFGLGMPKGSALPSLYKAKPLPDGRADLDQNGRISAAEAFQFGRLHEKLSIVARTSDCTLDDADIRKLLDDSAPFFRYEDSSLSKDKMVCAALALPANIERALGTFVSAQQELVASEIATLGHEGGSMKAHLTALKEKAQKLKRLSLEVAKAQDAVDASFARGEAVSEANAKALRDAEWKVVGLNREIFEDLHPLLHAACRLETERTRAILPKERKGKTACEDFDLYAEHGGTK